MMKTIHLRGFLLAAAALLVTAGALAQTTEPEGRDREPARDQESRRARRANADRRDATPASQSTSQPSGDSGGMDPKFRVLLERSIFAKSGNAARSAEPSTAPATQRAPSLSPEQSVVLIGVLAQDGEFVAFTENRTTGQIGTLRTGDDVAGGKVAAITLDSLAYAAGGTVREVSLGQNLSGETVATGLATATTQATSPGTPPSTLTPEQQAMMERLKARARSQRE
jgi:YD repeat-containing protein